VPLCPPQIPHGLTQDRNRASAVGGRRLTAWAMARPRFSYFRNMGMSNWSNQKRYRFVLQIIPTEWTVLNCLTREDGPIGRPEHR
jgi:hypothetical protein